MKYFLAFVFLNLLAIISLGQTTYVWLGGTTDYQVASNWTPTRTTPSTSDILSFTSSATVTNVPTQSISQLKLSSNAVVSLQAQSGGSRTITAGINNASGDDIDVPLGCELILAQNASGTASETFTIILTSTQASATANIAGTLTINKNTTTSFSNVFNVTNGTTTISGTVNNAGSLTGGTATSLVFSDGATYNHLRDNGVFPPGGNFTGANINVTGYVSGTISNFPSSIKSLIWNCASQATNITAILSSSTLVGSSTSLAISGNVNIQSTGSGAGAFVFNLSTVTVGGNMTVSANGFDFSRVTTGNTSNVSITGNLTINNASTRNVSGLTTGGGTANLTVTDFVQTGAGNFVMASANAAGGISNLIVKGNFTKSAGTFITTSTAGITGNVVFSGTTLQTFTSNSLFSNRPNIEVNNASGVTINSNFTVPGNLAIGSGSILNIAPSRILTISSTSTVTNTGSIVVQSSASASGALIRNSSISIPNVTIQQWVTGQRGYRVLSNPFSTALTPSTVGTANGITITGASDVKTYNGVSNAWTGSVSSIVANTPYSVFIRGLNTDFNGIPGLSNYKNNPTAFAYNVTGTLNGNSVTLNQNINNATDWTIAGNPFPAPVNSSALTGATAAIPYYIYSMTQNAGGGTRVKAGGWVAASSNSSTTTPIPMMGVVAYQASSIPTPLATFSVANTSINTTNGAQTGLFGEGDATTQLELQVAKDGVYQDKLFVRFDANSTEKGTERMDLPKLNNDVTNIYTITSDKARLAVDARKGIDATIPVGITSPVGKYTFTVASNNFVNASNVYLIDKLTDTKTALEPGATYSFEITTDAATQGDNRFELGTVRTQVQDAIANDGFTVKVLGNVVNNAVTVAVRGAKSSSVQITVIDMQGKIVSNTTSSREINNLDLANGSGIYFIKITDGASSIVSKVAKP